MTIANLIILQLINDSSMRTIRAFGIILHGENYIFSQRSPSEWTLVFTALGRNVKYIFMFQCRRFVVTCGVSTVPATVLRVPSTNWTRLRDSGLPQCPPDEKHRLDGERPRISSSTVERRMRLLPATMKKRRVNNTAQRGHLAYTRLLCGRRLNCRHSETFAGAENIHVDQSEREVESARPCPNTDLLTTPNSSNLRFSCSHDDVSATSENLGRAAETKNERILEVELNCKKSFFFRFEDISSRFIARLTREKRETDGLRSLR